MQTIEERLDHVKELLSDSDFLSGKGLSNEVRVDSRMTANLTYHANQIL